MIYFFIIVLSFNCFSFSDQIEVEYHVEQRTPCTYFESHRYAIPELGLVNCSWYAQKSCCKRTEVTSVFSKMLPLYGASQGCQNQLNYMMCYFCDPNQYIWYNIDTEHKVHVCADFCRMVYRSCRAAQYNGIAIGDKYLNETSFCEAQNFHLIEGKKNCFNYDPTVFGKTTIPYLNLSTMFAVMVTLICVREALHK